LLISDLVVGDRILVVRESPSGGWEYLYSDVMALPHAANQIEATFIRISTSEREIKLTAEHLIFGGPCKEAALRLVYASMVGVGSCLLGLNGQLAEVLSVDTVIGQGIYSAVAAEEGTFLVVNGLVASPFALNHAYAEFFYNFLRMAYRQFPFAFKLNYFVTVYSKLSDLVLWAGTTTL